MNYLYKLLEESASPKFIQLGQDDRLQILGENGQFENLFDPY